MPSEPLARGNRREGGIQDETKQDRENRHRVAAGRLHDHTHRVLDGSAAKTNSSSRYSLHKDSPLPPSAGSRSGNYEAPISEGVEKADTGTGLTTTAGTAIVRPIRRTPPAKSTTMSTRSASVRPSSGRFHVLRGPGQRRLQQHPQDDTRRLSPSPRTRCASKS